MIDFISDNSKVIDVGCDHGLLGIYLLKHKDNVKVILSDINENALTQARKNIKKYQLKNQLDIRCGNGLEVLRSNEVDTITISGLGSSRIINILYSERQKLDCINNIIIQYSKI